MEVSNNHYMPCWHSVIENVLQQLARLVDNKFNESPLLMFAFSFHLDAFIHLIDYGLLFPGTPIQNDLLEYFSLVHFVNSGILGKDLSYRYMLPSVMVDTFTSVGGRSEGGPGVPVTPLCKPFFKQTTYNIPLYFVHGFGHDRA